MKRYSQRSGHTAMAELNVTPLLDLAFVLLIIFIITTPLLTSNIPVQLPAGSRNNNQPVDAIRAGLADDAPGAASYLGHHVGAEALNDLIERSMHRRQR